MFERIMGLNVIDDIEYQKYRVAMLPILKSFGGAFGYDFRVSEVLLSKTEDKINRVLPLSFQASRKWRSSSLFQIMSLYKIGTSSIQSRAKPLFQCMKKALNSSFNVLCRKGIAGQ